MLHIIRCLNRFIIIRHAKSSNNMSQGKFKFKTYGTENKENASKDETIICCGSKCNPRKKIPCSPVGKKGSGRVGGSGASSEDLLIKRERNGVMINKKQTLATIQGGGKSHDPCKPKKEKTEKHGGGMKRWRNISLFGVLPLVLLLTGLVFGTHKEHEHPEFLYYPHMYKRTKPYWFKDGNRTAFHNSHQNALPPAGYEDEMDEKGVGQEPETEKDKKQRLDDFQKLRKDWQKNGSGSEAHVKPETVAAEKHESAAEAVKKSAEAEQKYPEAAAEKPQEVDQLYSKKLPIYDVEEEE
ncbi:uncharacterized protein LOC117587717 [Drosophila guanche]|uniref:Blast:Cytochrome c oxidase subunit 6A1, mitochondrial n=1 Tax=Drosophila guanche TaxID=7266 RepID=A0A3B0JVD3_DROGU|nr:uncharacterized protein LOC117587717 [Drosophila guanche]SPP86055.1 blast:Cytochrome c oxidase subunit 6A1%2C mitochondrial [Drosophila guanche]